MDTAYQCLPGSDVSAATADASPDSTSGPTRARLELLSPWLSPACTTRLWSEAWELSEITPWSLWTWSRVYGEEMAALAVAAGITESQMRWHLNDRRRPDRAVLEMLADLNCFPHSTPAARPLAAM